MKKSDEQMMVAEYWQKYKCEIADMRNWACEKNGCPRQSKDCERHCTLRSERSERSTTIKAYDRYIDNLKRFLVSPISEVSAFEVRDALKCVHDHCRGRTGRPYAKSTIQSHLSCLCDIFLFAKRHGHANNILAVFTSGHKPDPITKRIYDLIDPTQPLNGTLHVLKDLREQVFDRPRSLTIWQREKLMKKLMEALQYDGRSVGIAIICYAGIRPAECRKLLWKDIIPFLDHPDRAFLNIYDIRNSNGLLLGKTKTPSGHRKIPVHYELHKMLSIRLELVMKAHPDHYMELPVCCFGNEFALSCKDYQLANYADDLFLDIKISHNDLACYYLDASIERLEGKQDRIYDGEALCLYVLRKNFWTWMEAETQLTDREKRYVMGHKITDENRKDIRYQLNDENRIWAILRKMDQFVFCLELHRDLLERTLCIGDQLPFSNCGTITFNLSPELLERGGEIIIKCRTEEANDPIIYETPQATTPLKKVSMDVSSFPVFPYERTGINSQYENVLAHKHPARPLQRPGDETEQDPANQSGSYRDSFGQKR